MIYTLRKRMAFSVVMVFIACIAFAGQGFAKSIPQAEDTSHSSFSCTQRPHVQAPPLLTHAVAVRATHKPECPAGQVPQPMDTRSFSKEMVPSLHALQPHIAAGYHYVYGYQYATAAGGDAYFSQHTPYLSPSDAHTLAETSAQSADGNQIVEIGWTVDRGVNGDAQPHLFVFSWVNRKPNCYNGCGYVQYSSTFRPGQVVAGNGATYLYAIEYYQGNWWVYSQDQWLGYFPESIWSSKGVKFTQVGLVQWFGEISSGGGSKTQMGNGIFGSKAGSATITHAAFITNPTTATAAKLTVADTDPSCYNHRILLTPPAPPPGTSNSFGYGGPGC